MYEENIKRLQYYEAAYSWLGTQILIVTVLMKWKISIDIII